MRDSHLHHKIVGITLTKWLDARKRFFHRMEKLKAIFTYVLVAAKPSSTPLQGAGFGFLGAEDLIPNLLRESFNFVVLQERSLPLCTMFIKFMNKFIKIVTIKDQHSWFSVSAEKFWVLVVRLPWWALKDRVKQIGHDPCSWSWACYGLTCCLPLLED